MLQIKKKKETHTERETHTKQLIWFSGFKSMRARIISLQFVCAVLTRSAVPGCLGCDGREESEGVRTW